MSRITNRIFLGNIEDINNERFLFENNIGLVLNFAIEVHKPEWKNLKKYSLEPIYIPFNLRDNPNQNIIDIFPSVYGIVSEFIKKTKKNVLFNCYAGISRSATALIAFLMMYFKSPLSKVFDYVKHHRSIIRPNEGFMKQLEELQKRIYIES